MLFEVNSLSFLYEAHQDWQHYNHPDDKATLLSDNADDSSNIRINLSRTSKHARATRVFFKLASCENGYRDFFSLSLIATSETA